ncbi:hypothetical protein B0H13DRAFT_1879675 [Mycena leptocephala]|nr:hypothetical protein B0H13DRAFT_1879675 [Mycena leptocephala]
MSPHDEDSTDTLLDSAISLLQKSHKAPKGSWFTTPKALRLSSLILHSAMVIMHLALLGIWARGLEHRFTVALENEKVASFIITATSTAFGTIYSAILVFVTQALSRRRSLQMDQVLTATHDNAAAWGGIGAALMHLWYQKAVRASFGRTLTAALYLMTIAGLHITISSLFSLVTFSSPRSFSAPTHGLPAFNGTAELAAFNNTVDPDSLYEKMGTYAEGSLYFLPSVLDGTPSLGLQDGSLYDVLDINALSGNATVNASGFNITCGSVPEEARSSFEYSDGVWGRSNYGIQSTQVGMISSKEYPYSDSIVLYSTIPIVDSSGKSETWVDISPPMNTTVSSVQLLQCSLTLWARWYGLTPTSDFRFDYSNIFSTAASVADVDTQNVTLHDLENALSTFVACMFWTCHIPPTHKSTLAGSVFENGTITDTLFEIPTLPFLLPGNAQVTEMFAEARVELNIIAVSAGLAASVILMMLALASLRGQNEDDDLPLNGTGILHAIWLYRNHPELEKLLEQVEHPTDENLRAAGMVETKLVGKRDRKDESYDNISACDEGSTDTLLDSAISSIRMPHKALKRSWFTTPKALQLSSLIFHSALVVTHLALLGIWARGLEHRFTVALENEKVASFIITATSTAFGTIYSAILVFVTQALSRRRSLQMDQVLTATHDNAAAWGGIGAALMHLWYQKAVRASFGRTLTAALYLMTIAGLHVTISSLFSLVTFNSSRKPALTATNTLMPSKSEEMVIYAEGSLYFLPSVLDGTTSLGLQDGSLYDVLDINALSGNATVNASGFNITCGSVPEEDRSSFEYSDGVWDNSNYTIQSTRKAIHSDHNIIPDAPLEVGMISATDYPYSDSIVLYSTIPIVDSSGKSESWVDWARWYGLTPTSDFRSYPPTHRLDLSGEPFENGTIQESLSDIPTPPILLPGNAEVMEIFAKARVELNIIAVSAGLAASVVLTMLALASLRNQNEDDDLPLDGTGILHAIWLYRNHPELETTLEQVEHPTDENLRAAGMVKTRLVGKRVPKDESE